MSEKNIQVVLGFICYDTLFSMTCTSRRDQALSNPSSSQACSPDDMVFRENSEIQQAAPVLARQLTVAEHQHLIGYVFVEPLAP
jgi:hypothetical protein